MARIGARRKAESPRSARQRVLDPFGFRKSSGGAQSKKAIFFDRISFSGEATSLNPGTDAAQRVLNIMEGRIPFVKRSVFDKMGEVEQELSNLGTTQIIISIPAPNTAG